MSKGKGIYFRLLGLLAYHFYEGALWEQAFRYQLQAGLEALDLFETHAARGYLETVQTIAENELEDIPDEQRRAYLEGLGDVYANVGLFEQALAHYRQGLNLVRDEASNVLAEYLDEAAGEMLEILHQQFISEADDVGLTADDVGLAEVDQDDITLTEHLFHGITNHINQCQLLGVESLLLDPLTAEGEGAEDILALDNGTMPGGDLHVVAVY